MQLEAITLRELMQKLKIKYCMLSLISWAKHWIHMGHKDRNNRYWGSQWWGTKMGKSWKNYLLGTMFIIWVMGSLEAQTLALPNIPT